MKTFLTKRSVLIALTVLVFLIAWNRGINLLYAMFALLSSTLVVSHVVPKYALKGVSATRVLPLSAFEDDEIEIAVELKNSGYVSRHMIEVVDQMPAAGPGLEEPMIFAANLEGLSSRNYSFKLACYKRGEYKIGPLSLRTAYPLGITTAQRLIEDTSRSLIVYPRTFAIADFPLLAGRAVPAGGFETMSKIGGSDEFFGVREYRCGDSLRYIHWRSSARLGRLIVKEFEVRGSTEVTILLDLQSAAQLGNGKESTLEYAVKIAASISKYVLDRGHSLQLLGLGARPLSLPSAKGMHHYQLVLESLARVKADGGLPFPQVISFFSGLLRDGGTAVLVTTASGVNTGDFMKAIAILNYKRIRPICILINDQSFDDRELRRNMDLSSVADSLSDRAGRFYFVSKGDDLPTVFSS